MEGGRRGKEESEEREGGREGGRRMRRGKEEREGGE